MFGSKKSPAERQAARDLTELRLAVSAVGGILVRAAPLRFTAPGQQDVPVAGASVTVDRGEAAKRVTATRVALAGPFALLLRKDSTALFVTIEGADGSAMILQCSAKRELGARRLAMLVCNKYGSAS